MPAPRAVVTTEAPAAPLLLSLFTDCGVVGRIELTPKAAMHLAADLLNHIAAKEESR